MGYSQIGRTGFGYIKRKNRFRDGWEAKELRIIFGSNQESRKWKPLHRSSATVSLRVEV